MENLNCFEYKDRILKVEKAHRAYQKDYKSKADDRRSYHDERDRSPRYTRFRDDPYDRDYPPRYSDRYYESQANYGRGRSSYYDPDPYYYDDYRRGGGYRDYQNYEPSPNRYRRDEYYDSRQSQRSPRYYPRGYSKSDEYG